MRANHLERALHGFGAGVAEEHAVKPAQFRDALRQWPLIHVVVQIGSMDHEPCLLPDDLQQLRMSMSQGVDADAGDQIEIAFPGRVIDITTLAASQHERVTGIVLEQVLLLQIHDRLGGGLSGSVV